MMNSRHFFSFLPIVMAALLLTACQTSTGPDQNGNPYTPSGSGSIAGKVVTTGNMPASGVKVSVGSRSVWTTTRGEFFLDNIPAGDHVLVNFSSDALTPTQKVTTVRSGKTSWVEAAALPIGIKQTINATTGGTVTFSSGASVVFPANAFVNASGQAYSGSALVTATWFNPTGAQFYGTFPGEFSGLRTGGTETAIESFGFMRVDITAGGSALQLASGKEAAVVFPIPAALQGKAPASIPLWWYDETNGRWVEEGSATRSGNNYTGTVKHFSSWNCDMPSITSYLEGTVVDGNGKPISFAAVHTTGVDYTGASNTHTNDSGYFKIAVKSSSTARVWANYYIISSTPQDEATPATGLVRNIGTIVVPVDTANFCVITGRVIDNGDRPLNYVYIYQKDGTGKQIDYQTTTQDGKFKFFGETGMSYTLEISWYGDSTKQSVNIPVTCPATPGSVDLGDIKLDIGGATVTGRVVDTGGNPLPDIWVFSTEGGQNGSGTRESRTDSTGVFSLWVRPNKTFDVRFTSQQQQTKIVPATSGALGSTTNMGDITFP